MLFVKVLNRAPHCNPNIKPQHAAKMMRADHVGRNTAAQKHTLVMSSSRIKLSTQPYPIRVVHHHLGFVVVVVQYLRVALVQGQARAVAAGVVHHR